MGERIGPGHHPSHDYDRSGGVDAGAVESSADRAARMTREVEALVAVVHGVAAEIVAHARSLESATSWGAAIEARRAIAKLESDARQKLRQQGWIYRTRANGKEAIDAAGRALDEAMEQVRAMERRSAGGSPGRTIDVGPVYAETRATLDMTPEGIAAREARAATREAAAPAGPATPVGPQAFDAPPRYDETRATLDMSDEGVAARAARTATNDTRPDAGAPRPAAAAWERELLEALAPRRVSDARAHQERLAAIRAILASVPAGERDALHARLSAPSPGDELAERFRTRFAAGTQAELLGGLGDGASAAPAAPAAFDAPPVYQETRGTLDMTDEGVAAREARTRAVESGPIAARIGLDAPSTFDGVTSETLATEDGEGVAVEHEPGAEVAIGASLPPAMRARLEATAGRTLGSVRVRDDAGANDLAAAHDAHAVTVGQTIHLGAGEDVTSPEGERLLAHEVAHTIQGVAGDGLAAAAKPLTETTPADPAELEADRFADAAIAGRPFAIGESLGAGVAALDRRRRDRQDANDLTRERDGENAYMTVRAYDARGALVDLWTGPAYFHGDLPVEYVGQKKRGSWRWTRGGQPDSDGARLKIDSDAEGKAGIPVGRWAPDEAEQVMVNLRGLSDPFENHVVVNADGPLTMIGRLTEQSADGVEPLDLDAPGRVTGPLEPGAIVQSGELVIAQHERGTTFSLGGSVLHVEADDLADYAFTVHAQTSPRQRVIDLVGTPTVTAELHNDPGSAQLAYHIVRVAPGEVPAPDSGAGPVLPTIVVIGDTVRCDLLLDDDRIHIEAVQPGAKFAYWIDPEWSGEHGEARAVHIVATPGVVVDSLSRPGPGRKVIANPIYVQDPARVPKQGTPIEPADYLGAESLQYGATERDTTTVYTGAAGVTVRDHDLGVFVSIEIADPAAGGRFAWMLDRDPIAPAFRALVGPGVLVHVHEVTEPGAFRPPTVPYQDFGVAIDLRHTDDASEIPPQGTPLPADFLAGFAAREPDSRSYQDPITTAERVIEAGGKMAFDVVVGLVPGVGDAVDLAEATAGVDKWGNRLSLDERIVAGVAALLPFVPGAVGAVGRHVRTAMKLEGALGELAQRLGRTAPELEAMLGSLRRLDDDARAAARRVEEAIRIGDRIAPEDLAAVDRGLRAIGFGGLPQVRGGLHLANDPNAPRVPAPEGATPDDLERLNRAADEAPMDARDLARASELPAKTRELTGAVERRYRELTGSKKAPAFRVEILAERVFADRFASEKGRAVFVVEGDEAVIYARWDATRGELADEAAHLAQLADPDRAADLRFVSEGNLAGWADKSVADKLEFYDRKLAVEIDAKRRTLDVVEDAAERADVLDELADLERLQAELAAIDPADLARMNAGALPPPFDLSQPPRVFKKVRAKGVDGTQVPDRTDPTLTARAVSRDKGAPDYSSAYGDPGVEKVEQLGDAWKEQIVVTSGYEGTVVTIDTVDDAITIVVETRSGKRVSYALEKGAVVDPAIVVGKELVHGQTLAREVPREYRLVRGTRTDGSTFEVEEIRSLVEGRGWIRRGTENTRRGEVAEGAARAQVDAELAQKVKEGAITGSARLPGKSGGGGFDDVVVEFAGAGESIEATIRIREVKNYPNRHVPLGDFTAITTNYKQNLDTLSRKVDAAIGALERGQRVDDALAGLSISQLEAIQKQLKRGDVRVEVVLAPGTRLGAEGHHAARTLPALRAQHPNLIVTSMDNLEVSP